MKVSWGALVNQVCQIPQIVRRPINQLVVLVVPVLDLEEKLQHLLE
jgi:hypothetical protein